MPSILQSLASWIGLPLGLIWLMYVLWSLKKKTNIRGKVVLITGATSGVGEACAQVFYKAGCRVILAGRNMEKLQNVQAELLRLQLSQPPSPPEVVIVDLDDLSGLDAQAKTALEKFGRVDILINNAGISYRGQINGTSLDVDMGVMNTNYFGHVALTKAILPHMLANGGGHIVAVSSIQGRIAIPYRSAYSASKHAFQAFFDTLRAEVADSNIRVIVVSPAYIRTNLSHNALCADGSKYGIMDKTTASGMIPKYVAEQIVAAVVWGHSEVILAPFLYRLVVVLRVLAPGLFFKIMAFRAKKQKQQYAKDK